MHFDPCMFQAYVMHSFPCIIEPQSMLIFRLYMPLIGNCMENAWIWPRHIPCITCLQGKTKFNTKKVDTIWRSILWQNGFCEKKVDFKPVDVLPEKEIVTTSSSIIPTLLNESTPSDAHVNIPRVDTLTPIHCEEYELKDIFRVLKEHDSFDQMMNFFRLVEMNKFPMPNIAFRLFLDVHAKWGILLKWSCFGRHASSYFVEIFVNNCTQACEYPVHLAGNCC